MIRDAVAENTGTKDIELNWNRILGLTERESGRPW